MGNLLTSLFNTAHALGVYSQALQTTENNVVNANTPGYAKQVQTLNALPFDPSVGLPGGVGAGPIVSTRSAYAEEAVRTQQSAHGYEQQIAADLGQLQSYFDVSGGSNVSSSINDLFRSFSRLSINPNDTNSRQAVITQAQLTAQAFHHTAIGLGQTAANVAAETKNTVDAINQLADQIASINLNHARHPGSGEDAGLDATLNADLEELSQYAGFKALTQPDGSVTVYLGNQTPIVMGDKALHIQADFSSGQGKILNTQGTEITGQIETGQVGGMLWVYNTALPSYTSGLNLLAKSLADQVNTTLAGGLDQNDATPTMNLFAYDTTAGDAATLAVNDLTPDQIAAALPDGPGGNGNALALSRLGSAKNISGESYAEYYGSLAGNIGTDLSNATQNASTAQQVLTQAQTLRSHISSVSLDEEATQLIAFQRAYQATSKMLSILNDLTATVINIIPQ